MNRTPKSVKLGGFEIITYDYVKPKISYKSVVHHSDEADDDYVDDTAERAQQLNLSKRTHLLLALGRAAEMRASVEKHMRDSGLQLPDVRVPAPGSSQQALLPPKSSARPRRPPPRARQPGMSVDHQNAQLVPAAPGAQARNDSDMTAGEMSPRSQVLLADLVSRDEGSSGVSESFGASSSSSGDQSEIAPSLFHATGRAHSTERTLDGTYADDDSAPPERCSLSQQVSLRPSPPPRTAMLRPPPPARKFLPEASQDATSEPVAC